MVAVHRKIVKDGVEYTKYLCATCGKFRYVDKFGPYEDFQTVVICADCYVIPYEKDLQEFIQTVAQIPEDKIDEALPIIKEIFDDIFNSKPTDPLISINETKIEKVDNKIT